ncbi:GNAT family N-acetyltransferase [Nocardiopsis coralliicola]
MEYPEDGAVRLWGLGSERVPLGAAVVARREAAPALDLANFLYAVRPDGPAELAGVLGRAAELGVHRAVVERTTPAWVEAELAMRDWRLDRELRLELDPGARLAGVPPDGEVRPASAVDPDWSVRAGMFRDDHLEEDARRGDPPRPAEHTAATVAHRAALEEGGAVYHCAVRSGDIAGFACTWQSPEGLGVIEDVFVRPGHRGRGIATALLHHAVAVLRAGGALRIGISAEVDDTPKHLYARLGFRPRRLLRSWSAH